MGENGEKNREEKRKTILVVDDEELIRHMLSDGLTSLGHEVVSASDGQNGWNEYKKVKPDLILLDMIMPRMDGLTLLKTIRKEDSSTPVIMITGFSSACPPGEALRAGADGYLAKPFRLEKLLDLIKDLLATNPLELELRHLRRLTLVLSVENEQLKERIEQLCREPTDTGANEGTDMYRSILGAAVHTLKGEFMHIGHSIEEVRELASSSPGIVEECDVIDRSVAYSEILLRRLLDYLDMGKPSITPVNTFEVLRKTESLVRPRLPSNIQLGVKIDQSMKDQLVSANDEQLMGVLIELIQNAVNALRKKGGTIELKLEENDGEIAISVKDNGPGIPRGLRTKLFKEQVKSKSGLGLGLFLCNKVVTEFGGKLDLRTSSKKGTTFTVLLPKARDKKES